MKIDFRSGIVGEYIAIFLYSIKFYKLLHHRWKSNVGEIDIIMQRGKLLVFIEVKTRKHGIAESSISKNQRKRIINAANLFIAKNPKYQNFDIRFDLVVVVTSWVKVPIVIYDAWQKCEK
jgi:putative endonuclease